MPTETGRHRLYEKIKEQWGEEHAAELMSYLPPVGWADVATKGDLDALRVATKQDLALLRAEISAEIGDKIGRLDATLERQLGSLRDQLHRESISQLRWIVGIVLTTFVGLTGVFTAIVNWLG